MQKNKKTSNALHRSWKVWFAVALMLAAMFMYVLSLDDSIIPVFFK